MQVGSMIGCRIRWSGMMGSGLRVRRSVVEWIGSSQGLRRLDWKTTGMMRGKGREAFMEASGRARLKNY